MVELMVSRPNSKCGCTRYGALLIHKNSVFTGFGFTRALSCVQGTNCIQQITVRKITPPVMKAKPRVYSLQYKTEWEIYSQICS